MVKRGEQFMLGEWRFLTLNNKRNNEMADKVTSREKHSVTLEKFNCFWGDILPSEPKNSNENEWK